MGEYGADLGDPNLYACADKCVGMIGALMREKKQA
jgi:hypothetical protein